MYECPHRHHHHHPAGRERIFILESRVMQLPQINTQNVAHMHIHTIQSFTHTIQSAPTESGHFSKKSYLHAFTHPRNDRVGRLINICRHTYTYNARQYDQTHTYSHTHLLLHHICIYLNNKTHIFIKVFRRIKTHRQGSPVKIHCKHTHTHTQLDDRIGQTIDTVHTERKRNDRYTLKYISSLATHTLTYTHEPLVPLKRPPHFAWPLLSRR